MNASILESIRNDYLAALAEDAVNPKPDYSIDGQTVSRAMWRDNLWTRIKEITNLLQIAQPYELRGVVE